eukprot:scaffold34_cov124-Isochrysis_galbana.AAC.21
MLPSRYVALLLPGTPMLAHLRHHTPLLATEHHQTNIEAHRGDHGVARQLGRCWALDCTAGAAAAIQRRPGQARHWQVDRHQGEEKDI